MGLVRLEVVIVGEPLQPTRYQCALCSFFTSQILQLKEHQNDSGHLARGLTDIVRTATVQVDESSGETVDGSLSFNDEFEQIQFNKEDRDKNEHEILEKEKTLFGTKESFSCSICGKEFTKRSLMDSHVKSAHLRPKITCPECGKLFRDKHYYKHYHTVHSKQTFHCDLCDFKCKYKTALANHKLRKHAPRDLACGECDAVFSSEYSRMTHRKTTHSAVLYYCQFCAHKTSVKSSLELHVKSRHTITANFVCSFCPFETTDSVEIENHRATHHPLDEKMKRATRPRVPRKVNNYDCKVCGYKLNSKNSRLIHMRAKHGDLHFTCEECDYKTTNPGTLKRHVDNIHRRVKYPCPHCDLKASSPGALRTHEMFFHPDLVKLYACDKCNYRARSKTLLQKHLISKDRRHS